MEASQIDDEEVIAAAVASVARARSLAMNLIAGEESIIDCDSSCALALLQDDSVPRIKRSRRSYERPDYMGSEWGQWLTNLRELSSAPGGLDGRCREAVRFRATFRLPYELFLGVVDAVRPIFPADAQGASGRECIPVELKVLGALKILASGNTFQDIAAFSRMSVPTVERCFHHFCEKFAEGLWDTWVGLPTGDDLQRVAEGYSKCGYPGAIGSTDCTHVEWQGCPFSEQNSHCGKEGYPTLVMEVTCDHSGRIIAATKTYPGAENDTTVLSRDESIWRVRDEDPWRSHKFTLKSVDGSETEYQGAWLIVDGGYPKIKLLIPPYHAFNTLERFAWSKRIESVRKDAECCIGRVKGRFRIFRGAILFNTREKVDNAWFTACILHNMLHKYNKLDEMGVAENWVGSSGEEFAPNPSPQTVGGVHAPPEEGFEAFRQKLVNHFTWASKNNQVLWFKRVEQQVGQDEV